MGILVLNILNINVLNRKMDAKSLGLSVQNDNHFLLQTHEKSSEKQNDVISVLPYPRFLYTVDLLILVSTSKVTKQPENLYLHIYFYPDLGPVEFKSKFQT